MNMRQFHNRRTSLFFLIALGLHIPIFLALGAYNDKPTLITLALSGLVLAAPLTLYLMRVSSSLLPCSLAFSSIAFSGLLIHLGGGMIEMHFHIFVMMAAFIAFGLISPILVGLSTAAVHHLLFFFLLPTSVFNYKASVWIVLLHAGFVIVETVPALYIASKFKKLIDIQDTTLGALNSISDHIGSSLKLIHSSGQDLSLSTAQAATSIEETGASLETIESMVKLNSSNAKQAAELSRLSTALAVSGDEEVNGLVIAMGRISEFSKKIEEITHLIDDIAFQTNLLALNAAVEAARAGEQGKGFAVVADAVRSLAQRSATAASDINSLIFKSRDLVESGVGATTRSGDTLKKIVTSVKKVAQLNQEIALASEEQFREISSVTQSINKLDKAAQNNASSSENLASTADELSMQSKRMKTLVLELQDDFGNRAA